MEIAERVDHPFFVGTQYHPEFLSRPLQPAPLFLGLLEAAVAQQP
jgi:CTP synthase